MPKRIVKGVGMMQRHQVQYEPGEPGALEACVKAWDAALPVAQPDDMPGDALNRHNAERCRAILAKFGLADLMEGKGAVNLGPLREKGLDEDSAQWIAAHWLGAYNSMMTMRAKLVAGDTNPSTIGNMLMVAQEMGRMQERMWWRAGVEKIDPENRKTWIKRETLALAGRRQVAGGHDGNKMKGQKSFATMHGARAQARADALFRENPSRTWAFIRAQVAAEFKVSAETVKNALRNPKKNG